MGTIEAVHCGVPILVIPLYADQYSNAAFIVKNGIGIKMIIREATERNIVQNLKTLMSHK